MGQLSKEDVLHLQARSMYNNAVIKEVIDGGGYTTGKDNLVIEVNRMSWGLFEQSVLNAGRVRPDLRKRNPELYQGERDCENCQGAGKHLYERGHPEHSRLYDIFYRDVHGELEADAPPIDYPITKFCSPCQGTGLKLKGKP